MWGKLLARSFTHTPFKNFRTKREKEIPYYINKILKRCGGAVGCPFLYFLNVFLDIKRQILYNKSKKESSFAVWYFPR